MERKLAWVVCAILLVGCSSKGKEVSVEPELVSATERVQSRMAALFPQDGSIPGWRMRDKVTFFNEKTLFQHINGAAEAFFAYDFQLCGTTEYNPESGPLEDEFIVVDVYDMGRSINAFGMYASELYSESEFVDVGSQGYVESSSLNFWKGPYYVKITGSSPVKSVTKANMELAKYIAEKIPEKAGKPAMLSLLPSEGLIPGTEQFTLNNILGYSFLRNGSMAKYQIGDEEKTLVIMESSSVDSAKELLAEFASFERESGTGMVEITDPGEDGFTVKDKYYGHLSTVRQGRYIMLLMASLDDSAAIALLKRAIDNISE